MMMDQRGHEAVESTEEAVEEELHYIHFDCPESYYWLARDPNEPIRLPVWEREF